MKPISDETEVASQKASDLVSQSIQFAIMSNKSERAQAIDEAAYISCVGVSGGLHLLAGLVGKCSKGNLKECKSDDKHSPLEHINPTSIMFAAILTAVASSAPIRNDLDKDEEGRKNGYEFEFGPDIILEALAMTEKVMGHKPDKYLATEMVKAVREIEGNAEGALGKFLAQKPSSPSMPN